MLLSHNLEEAYRVCEELVVLTGGGVAARGPKEEIFRYPPSLEVARLTGCKNFSRARRDPGGRIEALDWGCALRVTQKFSKQPGHIAIRAHHIRIHPASAKATASLPSSAKATAGLPASGKATAGMAATEERDNVFPCWLAAVTETPFRVTLDLRLASASAKATADMSASAETKAGTPASLETEADTPAPLETKAGAPTSPIAKADPSAEASAKAEGFQLQAEVFKQEWEAFCDSPQPWQVELPPDRLILFPE